jgi:sugar phosphate isomerase/epimerase
MIHNATRRQLIAAAAGAPLIGCGAPGGEAEAPASTGTFDISLAQWSLHKRFYGGSYREAMRGRSSEEFARAHREAPETVFGGDLDPLDFPVVARRDFDIGAIEYVNRFYASHANDQVYLTELKNRCSSEGVRSVLIMCDDEGNLGDPNDARRRQAVQNHHKWIDAAKFLGCHSIRVNARSEGSREEQSRLAADGLHQLGEYGAQNEINVLVENHGGLSSDASWLAGVIRAADSARVGTLPDFGNFRISETESYDPYLGVEQLMPYAKGVSAKCYDFDEAGMETTLDFPRLMRSVELAGYHSFVGIEYEGERLSETDGIRAAKALLERIRAGEFAAAAANR